MLIGYWHQMAIPEDIHVSNIIQIEQAIFRNTYVYANIYIFIKQQLIKKEAMDLKEDKEFTGGLRGGKGRKKWYNAIII